MKKVITYGTYDLLHHGHIRLLERAKSLGDYLIVGVTSDAFDKARGKINVQQTLEERIEAVRALGIADKIIIEEYEGQKIDDIKKYGVDIFTVGSDWVGKFDYLNEFCTVKYLPRTLGISSTDIRSDKNLNVGLVGYSKYLNKVFNEIGFVNGFTVNAICAQDRSLLDNRLIQLPVVTDNYQDFLSKVDVVYVHSRPDKHYSQVKEALLQGKHVMCEAPIARTRKQAVELFELAKKQKLVLMDSLRTAYSIAYQRLLLLIKSGCIGEVVAIDSTCTSLVSNDGMERDDLRWGSLETWGPTVTLPVFQILGTNYEMSRIFSRLAKDNEAFDEFSLLSYQFDIAVATCKVGDGIKSEGELIVSGTKGYVYVPAPWWKTEYFEIRYEDSSQNRRYFYQLEGEGIRYEWVAFNKMITSLSRYTEDRDLDTVLENEISEDISIAFCFLLEQFDSKSSLYRI